MAKKKKRINYLLDEALIYDKPMFANGGPLVKRATLTPEQDKKYQSWRSKLPQNLQYEGDYDLARLWMENPNIEPTENLHFPDRYKLPNHPTFSNESMYFNPSNQYTAGKWDTTGTENYIPYNKEYKNNGGPLKRHSIEELHDPRVLQNESGETILYDQSGGINLDNENANEKLWQHDYIDSLRFAEQHGMGYDEFYQKYPDADSYNRDYPKDPPQLYALGGKLMYHNGRRKYPFGGSIWETTPNQEEVLGKSGLTGPQASMIGGIGQIGGDLTANIIDAAVPDQDKRINVGKQTAMGAAKGLGQGAMIGANPLLVGLTGGLSIPIGAALGAGAGAISGNVNAHKDAKANHDALMQQYYGDKQTFANGGSLGGDPKKIANAQPTVQDSLNLYNAYQFQKNNSTGTLPPGKVPKKGVGIFKYGEGLNGLTAKEMDALWKEFKQIDIDRQNGKLSFKDAIAAINDPKYNPLNIENYKTPEELKKGEKGMSPRQISEDYKIAKYYESLQFDDPVDRQYHSSPDIVHSKIRPIGIYHDGSAWSPIYKKPIGASGESKFKEIIPQPPKFIPKTADTLQSRTPELSVNPPIDNRRFDIPEMPDEPKMGKFYLGKDDKHETLRQAGKPYQALNAQGHIINIVSGDKNIRPDLKNNQIPEERIGYYKGEAKGLYAMGGQMENVSNQFGNQMSEFQGAKHEDGGIKLGENSEVEAGEVKWKDYIFSDQLKPEGSKMTFARKSKLIKAKYKGRENDAKAQEVLTSELAKLAAENDIAIEKHTTELNKYRNGGRLKYGKGGNPWEFQQFEDSPINSNNLPAFRGSIGNYGIGTYNYVDDRDFTETPGANDYISNNNLPTSVSNGTVNPYQSNFNFDSNGNLINDTGTQKTGNYDPNVYNPDGTPKNKGRSYGINGYIDNNTGYKVGENKLFNINNEPQMDYGFEQTNYNTPTSKNDLQMTPEVDTSKNDLQMTPEVDNSYHAFLDESLLKQRNKGIGYAEAGLLSSNIAGIDNLVKSLSPAHTSFDRVKLDRLNLQDARDLNARDSALGQRISQANVRNNATSSGQALSNLAASNSALTNSRINADLNTYLQEGQANTQIANQEKLQNNQISMNEKIANEQNKANAQSVGSASLASINNNNQGYFRDKQMQRADFLANKRNVALLNQMFHNYQFGKNPEEDDFVIKFISNQTK